MGSSAPHAARDRLVLEAGGVVWSRRAERMSLALVLAAQTVLSVAIAHHLRDQFSPDAVAYARAAQLWLHGRAALAVNATWGVLCPLLTVPGLALGMHPAAALRLGQSVAALVATAGTHVLLGCFAGRSLVRLILVSAGALFATASSQTTSDASFVAVFVWMAVALLSPREELGGLPRPLVGGALAGLSFLARPIGLPMGVAMVVVTEIMRARPAARWSQVRRALTMAAIGWAAVALPWIAVLSLHYGKLTLSHSPRLVLDSVGPRSSHPFNLPSFTRLHRPPEGRITTWEDPSLVSDAGLAWSPFESNDAWRHQIRLIRENLRIIVGFLVAFDGDGLAMVALVLVPLLAFVRPRPGVGWRERWLLLPLLLHVGALAPLHVELRYLWSLFPVSLAALGALAARVEGWLAPPGGATDRPRRLVVAVLVVLILLPLLATDALYPVVLLGTPARHELALVRGWADDLRRAGQEGPVASWSPYLVKSFDAEGLYLAWDLQQPWFGNVATNGSDAGAAVAMGARVMVAKTELSAAAPPAWLQADWSVLETTEAKGVTIRDGRYFILVRR